MAPFLLFNSLTPLHGAMTPRDWGEVMKLAYPGRITQVQGSGEDAALKLDGRWYLWADRRLLPKDLAGEVSLWDSHSFFPYNPNPEDRGNLPPERIRDIEERLNRREERRINRNPEFFDRLWDYHQENFSETGIVQVRLLGFPVRMNRRLSTVLTSLNRELTDLAKKDGEVAAWVKSLVRIDGFVDRRIAGTRSRSSHSYGTALDMIPRTYGDRVGYWRWAYRPSGGWFAQAWKNRWQVPPSVVDAFYRHGFVWGGNWLLFDPIHFEYRPEQILAFHIHGPSGPPEANAGPTAPGFEPGRPAEP